MTRRYYVTFKSLIECSWVQETLTTKQPTLPRRLRQTGCSVLRTWSLVLGARLCSLWHYGHPSGRVKSRRVPGRWGVIRREPCKKGLPCARLLGHQALPSQQRRRRSALWSRAAQILAGELRATTWQGQMPPVGRRMSW